MFKTPEEAIEACHAACEDAWNTFIQVNKLDPAVSPEAFAIAKKVFFQGYMMGARFVSGYIVSQMTNAKMQPPTPPQS